MSQTESYSDNRLLYLILEALGGNVSTPASSRLVAVTPTGGSDGTGNETVTFPQTCLELGVTNDSETDVLTFAVRDFVFRIRPGANFDELRVQPFTEVIITSTGPWRCWGYAPEDSVVPSGPE